MMSAMQQDRQSKTYTWTDKLRHAPGLGKLRPAIGRQSTGKFETRNRTWQIKTCNETYTRTGKFRPATGLSKLRPAKGRQSKTYSKPRKLIPATGLCKLRPTTGLGKLRPATGSKVRRTPGQAIKDMQQDWQSTGKLRPVTGFGKLRPVHNRKTK